jgi:hypothetical protein
MPSTTYKPLFHTKPAVSSATPTIRNLSSRHLAKTPVHHTPKKKRAALCPLGHNQRNRWCNAKPHHHPDQITHRTLYVQEQNHNKLLIALLSLQNVALDNQRASLCRTACLTNPPVSFLAIIQKGFGNPD